MNFSLSSLFTKVTVAASAAALLAACGDPDYPTPTPATGASTAQGRVQVVNVAPGSGDAQLRSIDNTSLATLPAGVPYLATSGYTNVPAGQRLLAYSTPNNLNNNLIYARGAFSTNTSSTVFLTDQPTRTASGTDQGGVRSVVLLDNLSAPAANRTRIRFINLSPSYTSGADSLGLFAVSVPVSTNANDPVANRYLFTPIGRTYRAITYTIPAVAATATTPGRSSRSLRFENFTDVPSGTYVFQVRRSATATSNPSQVIVQATPLTFDSGKIYTIYTRGLTNNTTTPLGLSVLQHN